MKRTIVLAIVFVLGMSSLASADNIDVSASLGGLYTVSLDAAPDNSGISLLLDYGVRNPGMQRVREKGDVDPGEVGYIEIFEGRRSTVIVGLGYEVGLFTPWLGMAAQTVKTREDKMVAGEAEEGSASEPDPVKVQTDITEPKRGVALGLNAEYWSGPLGVLGTVAKLPEGVLLNARVKYNVSGIGTAHIGYIYNSHTGHGVVAGLGLSY